MLLALDFHRFFSCQIIIPIFYAVENVWTDDVAQAIACAVLGGKTGGCWFLNAVPVWRVCLYCFEYGTPTSMLLYKGLLKIYMFCSQAWRTSESLSFFPIQGCFVSSFSILNKIAWGQNFVSFVTKFSKKTKATNRSCWEMHLWLQDHTFLPEKKSFKNEIIWDRIFGGIQTERKPGWRSTLCSSLVWFDCDDFFITFILEWLRYQSSRYNALLANLEFGISK